MKEPVRRTKHPWLAGVCVIGIVGLYFYLLANSDYPEPGPNIVYEVAPYKQVDDVETRFEETGRIDPQMEDPRALATGPDGKVYVAGAETVTVHAADGAELARFKVNGTPSSMALGADGEIFLGIRDHVEVLDIDGVVQAVWEDLGEKAYITSIAARGEEVYVADAGNRVVIRFDRQGVIQARIGKADSDRDIPGIIVPSPYLDVAINDEGTLWIVNPGRLGLESYRSNGDLITSWYKPSLKLEGFSGCCNPSHIAFDVSGRLIACDKGLVRVKAYDVTSGEFDELVAGTDLFPKEQSVRDIAVDINDRILVLDPRENVVRIFERRKDV